MNNKTAVLISTVIGLLITGIITVISNFNGLWVSITIPVLGVMNEVCNVILEYFANKEVKDVSKK